MRHLLQEVMICYPKLVELDDYEGNKRWGVCVLFNKKDEEAMAKFQAMKQAIVETFKSSRPSADLKELKDYELPYVDGGSVNKGTNAQEFVESMVLNKCYTQQSQGRPPCFENYDRTKEIPVEEIPRRFVNGTICNVVVDFYLAKKGGNRICCGLGGLQYVNEGKPFGPGQIIPEAIFKNYDTGIDENSVSSNNQNIQEVDPNNLPI